MAKFVNLEKSKRTIFWNGGSRIDNAPFCSCNKWDPCKNFMNEHIHPLVAQYKSLFQLSLTVDLLPGCELPLVQLILRMTSKGLLMRSLPGSLLIILSRVTLHLQDYKEWTIYCVGVCPRTIMGIIVSHFCI